MDKPPAVPMRKVESSTSSLSSIDIHITPNSKNSFYDAQSRRLVDYFVVFTSKPKLKKQKKPKINTNDDDDDNNDLSTDDDTNNKGKNISPRSLCCKKKQSKIKISTKKKNKSNTKKVNRRASTSSREIHLINNLLDDDETPIFKNRKRNGLENSFSNKNKNSNKIDTLLEGDDDDSNSSGLFIPVTVGSNSSSLAGSSDLDTDVEPDYEDEIARKTKKVDIHKVGTKEKDKHHSDDDKTKDTKDTKEDDEPMTPSRMRAKLGFSDDETDNEKKDTPNTNEKEEIKQKKKKKKKKERSSSKKSRSRQSSTTSTKSKASSRGASENIHIPGEEEFNGSDDNNESNSNVLLVPVETARYPPQDHTDNPFNPMISHFCFPQGQGIQLTTDYVMPRIHYFVLTNDRGKKMYGTCLTVYEEFDLGENPEIDEEDLRPFYRNDDVFVETTDSSESSIEVSLDFADKCPQLYHPKVLCILSSWPYLHAFREYLSQLYRLATMTNMMTCPIERYVLNICEEVPAPPPGMFEIRLQILNSTIRFWAPPANQPIPYVSIPFNVLFECLDINNVLFVWYALTLEHKVLLVSSQNSLLTLCSEILSALLFPMEWSHLYIPILPLFLSQMLDAPFPYLCGISRDNLTHAINDVNEETIVVDLDKNVITKGKNTPPFPPMPLKRRSKLEAILQRHVGDIFWSARGVTKEEVENFEEARMKSVSKRNIGDMNKTLRIWKEKLISYDDAFNLAFTPNSENVLNGEKSSLSVLGEFAQTKWDCVQEGFFSFFTTMLRDYKRFISNSVKGITFREREFVNAQRPDFKPFLKEFVLTQQFNCFITKRMYNKDDADVLFFDQSIQAKRNRSKMVIKKKRTPFLQSAKAQKQLRTVEAAKPESSYNILERIYAAASDEKQFSYSKWPEVFDHSLLQNPRKIPDVIAAEFDRLDTNGTDSNELETSDFIVTDINDSVELTTFTIFFTLCCQFIGKELEAIQNQYLPQGPDVMSSKGSSPKDKFQDCANVCTVGQTTKSSTVDSEYTASYKDYAMEDMKNDQLSGFANELLESEIETARVFAFAELDLVFSALNTLFLRKMKPSTDALKALMSACGRCGSSKRATKLMKMIQDNGIHIDSETYFYFIMNAPLDEYHKMNRNHGWSAVRWTNSGTRKHKTKKRPDDSYLDGSDNSSFSTSSFQETWSTNSSNIGPSKHLPPRPRASSTRKKPIVTKDKLRTTDQVDRHINIGESLLKYLYSDLEVDMNCATCRSCGATLLADQVRYGWKPSFTDYTTECLHCKNSFVPSFVIRCNDPKFVGSQGPGSPLHCEFLSPWLLLKELHTVTQSRQDDIMDPMWRNDGGMNATIWWNLILAFQRHKLPITFLIQGSFRERLIMPMTE